MSKKLNILLINSHGYGSKLSTWPPVGCLLLGTILQHETFGGHHVEIFDPGIAKKGELAAYLEDKGDFFDFVGVSTTSVSKKKDAKNIRLAAKYNPGALVLAGGYYATLEPGECASFLEADILVLGHGEITLLELIDRLSELDEETRAKVKHNMARDGAITLLGERGLKGFKEPKKPRRKANPKEQKRYRNALNAYKKFVRTAKEYTPIKGIVVRFIEGTERTIVEKGREPLTQEEFDRFMNEIGHLDFSLIDLDKYFAEEYGGAMVVLFTGRGCLYNCIFCTAPKFCKHQFIGYSPEFFVETLIATLKEYPKIKHVFLADESLTLYRERAMRIFKLIKDARGKDIPNDVNFGCFATVKAKGGMPGDKGGKVRVLDKELIKLAKEANFERLGFGFESGSDKILKILRKPHKRKDLYELVDNFSEVGDIELDAFFMLGVHELKFDDILDTAELVVYCCEKLGMNFNIAFAYGINPWTGLEIADRMAELERKGEGIVTRSVKKIGDKTAIHMGNIYPKDDMTRYFIESMIDRLDVSKSEHDPASTISQLYYGLNYLASTPKGNVLIEARRSRVKKLMGKMEKLLMANKEYVVLADKYSTIYDVIDVAEIALEFITKTDFQRHFDILPVIENKEVDMTALDPRVRAFLKYFEKWKNQALEGNEDDGLRRTMAGMYALNNSFAELLDKGKIEEKDVARLRIMHFLLEFKKYKENFGNEIELDETPKKD